MKRLGMFAEAAEYLLNLLNAPPEGHSEAGLLFALAQLYDGRPPLATSSATHS